MKILGLIRDANNKLIAYTNLSKDRMFSLNNRTHDLKCLYSMKDAAWLWPLHYGHLNF